MSYEVTALESTPAASQSSQPIMRTEVREYDPYKPSGPKALIGQGDRKDSPAPKGPEKAPEETVKLSPQSTELARREQKFRSQQQAFEKDRAALAAEKEELAQLRSMKEKLSAKDYSALDGVVDYNDYSQYQVNKLNSTDPQQEQYNKLNSKVEELEKTTKNNLEKQFEAAVNERRIAMKDLIATKGDEFKLIKKMNAEEHVVQWILDCWENDGEEISVEQASKEVQEDLMRRALAWKALLEEEAVEAIQDATMGMKKQLPPLKQGLKTLTNHVTAGDGKGPRKSLSQMSSDAERWAEARRRAEEKLQTR